jgi:hypothetical protein
MFNELHTAFIDSSQMGHDLQHAETPEYSISYPVKGGALSDATSSRGIEQRTMIPETCVVLVVVGME